MDAPDSAPDPSALRKVDSGATFEVWQCRSSSQRLDWPRAGVVKITLTGHGVAAFAPACLQRMTEALRKSQRLTLLVDAWDMPTYESGYRAALCEWTVAHRARLEPIHVLARSQVASMGIAVANLALGGLIQKHILRPSFLRVVQQLGPAIPARGK